MLYIYIYKHTYIHTYIHTLHTRPAERQQEAWGKVVIQSPPPTFRLWPMCRKEFHSGLRPLRHFEEFLRTRPLQSEAPQSTRPWGNLPPLTPLSAGLVYTTMYMYIYMYTHTHTHTNIYMAFLHPEF